MGRNPQDIPVDERVAQPIRDEGPREIFPLVMNPISGTGRDGPKDFRPLVEKIVLDDVGEPTEEELAAIEAGLDPDEAAIEADLEDEVDEVEEDVGEPEAPRRLRSVKKD